MVRLYLDAAPVIYAVEQVAPFAARVDTYLALVGAELVTSDLTRMECRVKPLRDGDMELLHDFDDFFAKAVSAIVPLSRQVIDKATELRAEHGLKTPDAIHLAAAMLSACDKFLTNDHRLDHAPGITIVLV
jgi:predicted nucleic acid-binding protein